MKLRTLVVLFFGLILSGCGVGSKKSGIEIISYPQAKVYIGEKEAGMTPYKNNSLSPGELNIRLVSGGQEWSKTIHLQNGANTVVNREFGDNGTGGGYTLYFESTGNKERAGIMISSRPDKSTVFIDDEVKGYSPVRVENAGDGDRKLTISFPGYKSINSYIRLVNGYQLVVEADLAEEKTIVLTPTVTPTPLATDTSGHLIEIKETETGWLRVRDTPSSSGTEVTKVKPKEKYKMIDQNKEWLKIDLGNGKSGWILAKYADIS
jgi:hypothetical protein